MLFVAKFKFVAVGAKPVAYKNPDLLVFVVQASLYPLYLLI